MTNPKETRRIKAMNLRYKKPIAKGLNLDDIRNSLWDISEACGDVQYYIDSDDETLLNALDGDEDDAYEFKMMFSTLSAECEQMQYDLGNEYIPEYFDYSSRQSIRAEKCLDLIHTRAIITVWEVLKVHMQTKRL